MAEPMKETKVRIQLDLTAKQAERFDGLVSYCELGSRKELFNVAMSLFNWATEEASKGKKIASYDEKRDHVETILIPALENARLQTASSNEEVKVGPDLRQRDRRSFAVRPAGGNLASAHD